jgi:sarcosine oxidase
MNASYDVIVVGVGAMGSSACWHLAQGGLRVLGLERFDIPNTMGSSHGQSRAIRLAYYEHPDYVPLLRRAYALWDALEAEAGEKILYRIGGLYLSPPDGQVVAGSALAAKQHGVEHELLDIAEVHRRFDAFGIPENWSALYEPEAGFLLPERAISAFAAAATKLGAELHPRELVLRWSADTHGITVDTDHATYHADRLILCCGAWTSRIAGELGIPLTVTRQVMGWVAPRDPSRFELGAFPIWNIEKLDGTLYYGFPLFDGPGLKLAHHGRQTPADPDRVERSPLPGDEETFRPALRDYLPAGDGPLLEMRVCLYTNSPDHHFIIDRHPHFPRVTLACGFSGHGFKFASVIGEVLSQISLTGRSTLPMEFLSIRRFKN